MMIMVYAFYVVCMSGYSGVSDGEFLVSRLGKGETETLNVCGKARVKQRK
jgi:hypothetical protein